MTTRVICVCLLLTFSIVACHDKSRDELMSEGKKYSEQGNPKGAVVVYKNLLENNPDDTFAMMALSEAYLLAGNIQQAASELSRTIEKFPETPGIALLTARIRNAERNPDAALEALSPLLEIPKAPADALEQAGYAMFLKQQYAKSLEWYKQALNASKDFTKAKLGLAECFIQLGQMDEAEKQLGDIIKVNPKDRSALNMLAQLNTIKNNADGAIEAYGKLAKYYQNDILSRYIEAFLRLGKRNEVDFAESVAKKLTDEFPNMPDGYKLNGLTHLARNENKQAVEALLLANKKRQDIDTQVFLAQAYLGLGNLETAVSHLQAALSRNPNMVAQRQLLASIYLRQNRMDEAIAETQKIFEKHPSDEAGERILADALVAKREYDKGLEIFSRMADQKVQSPVVYLKKGMLLALKGDDEAAEKDLRKAVELAGSQLEPRLFLAGFLSQKNRVDEAVDVLAAGQAEGGGTALSYNAMAKLRIHQGNLEQARALLNKAKSIDPSTLITYYNLAALHTADGELDKAAGEFEAALTVKPDDLRSLAGAAGCREALGDLSKAQALLEHAAQTKNPQASLALANYFIRRSDKSKALAVLENCLAVSPDAIPVWLLKSKLLAANGDQAKALASLDRVESLNLRTGLLEKSKYFLSQNNQAKSMEMASKLIDMAPNNGDYYLPLAEIQQAGGQFAAAKATLNKALQADPGNPRVFAALSAEAARSNNPREALEFLDKAIIAGMDPAMAHTSKGVILQASGDVKAAADQYEESLRYSEAQPLALNNLAMIYADRKGDEAKALALAVRACSLQTNNAMMLDTLGYTLLKNGRKPEAQAVLERAKKIMASNPDIDKHLNLARETAN